MECDSIHPKIEQKSKHVPVYIPEDSAQLIRDSRRNPAPYKVHTMMFDDFYDYKTFSESIISKNSLPKNFTESFCFILCPLILTRTLSLNFIGEHNKILVLRLLSARSFSTQ